MYLLFHAAIKKRSIIYEHIVLKIANYENSYPFYQFFRSIAKAEEYYTNEPQDSIEFEYSFIKSSPAYELVDFFLTGSPNHAHAQRSFSIAFIQS